MMKTSSFHDLKRRIFSAPLRFVASGAVLLFFGLGATDRAAAGTLGTNPLENSPLTMSTETSALPSARSSEKSRSRIVTEEMRAHAVRNVERFPWAQQRVAGLKTRVAPYMEVTDDFLWHLLPSQGMPRSSRIELRDSPPPASEDRHFGVRPTNSRDLGLKTYYHTDPFRHPWKIQSRGSGIWYPDNDFSAYYQSGLDGAGRFSLDRADRSLLKPPDSKVGGPPPMIDDGRGAEYEGKKFFFAAHYAFAVWSEAIDLVRDLAELYTLTNDPLYAHKAGVLLDRMADLYPEMDYTPWFKLGMEASTGLEGLGRVQGKIWETFTAKRLALAYDQIFDALLTDEALLNFVQAKTKEYPLLSRKTTNRQIAGHIEDNLLKEFLVGIHDKRIGGNPGMVQVAMAATAIALDDGEATEKELDWLFEPDGGRLPGILVDELSRDGFGHEEGLGYASLPPQTTFETAELLKAYPEYERGDLYADFPKLRNSLSGGQRVTMAGGSILHVGDGGRAMWIGEWGYPVPLKMALLGWRLSGGSEESLREIVMGSRNDSERIPGDIYAAEPEEERTRIIEAMQDLPAKVPESFNSGGIGFSVLQAPSLDNPRMVALNYGPMGHGHGHRDRLGLHLIDRGAYMATDLGYPTLADVNPERLAWTSHTVSHNTVMVDDSPMERDSVFSGKVRLFAEAGPIRVMDVDSAGRRVMQGRGHSRKSSAARPLYAGVDTYRRCVVMVDVDPLNSYVLDLFWVRGGKKHTLIQNGGGIQVTSDWTPWKKQPKGTAAGRDVAYGEFYDGENRWDYQGSGLMFLTNVARARPDKPFWVDWKIAEPYNKGRDLHFRVHNLGPLEDALLGDGPTPSHGPLLRYLLRTREGEELASQFVSVLESYEDTPFVKSCRVLRSSRSEEPFSIAVEVQLYDGRRDVLLVNEEQGTFQAGGWTLEGRIGWVRTDAQSQIEQWAMVDATRLETPQNGLTLEPARYEGKIVAIDESDQNNVLLRTDLENVPSDVKGRYVIVANHQRADASYRIKAVEADGRINIGSAALDEMHVDPNDYSKGTIKNIRPGERFFIANSLFEKAR